MEFKQLLGRRIYLELPEEPKSLLHLDEESRAALEAERMKTYCRLKVYAVGTDVTDIKAGDEVMIDPGSASKIMKIPLGEDKEVLLLSIFDICHIW